jgi:hypothetical protein
MSAIYDEYIEDYPLPNEGDTCFKSWNSYATNGLLPDEYSKNSKMVYLGVDPENPRMLLFRVEPNDGSPHYLFRYPIQTYKQHGRYAFHCQAKNPIPSAILDAIPEAAKQIRTKNFYKATKDWYRLPDDVKNNIASYLGGNQRKRSYKRQRGTMRCRRRRNNRTNKRKRH